MQTVPERHSNSGQLGFDESSRRYQALLHTADLAAQADANSCVCAGSAAWEKAMPFDLWRCIRRRPESGSRATKAFAAGPALSISLCPELEQIWRHLVGLGIAASDALKGPWGARPGGRIPGGNRKQATAGPRPEANSRRI